MTRRLFLDMDGVIADFDLGAAEAVAEGRIEEITEYKAILGAYLSLKPLPGAIEGVVALAREWDVWIATKIPAAVPQAAADKHVWIHRHLPALRERVIITPNKGALGGADDVLVDDRPHKARCREFPGRLIHFGAGGEVADWEALLACLLPTPGVAEAV